MRQIRDQIDQYEATCQENLKELVEIQDEKIEEINRQIGHQEELLQNENLNLTSLENHSDNEIVYMTKILQDQRQKLIDFSPEISLDDISITL